VITTFTPDLKLQHLVEEPVSFVADDVGRRNSDVVEVDQARVRAVHPQLVDLLCLTKSLRYFLRLIRGRNSKERLTLSYLVTKSRQTFLNNKSRCTYYFKLILSSYYFLFLKIYPQIYHLKRMQC
jgi:hypothetical protein